MPKGIDLKNNICQSNICWMACKHFEISTLGCAAVGNAMDRIYAYLSLAIK